MELVQTVELFISCQKLRSMDLLSKSDPCVVIYEGTPQNTHVNSPQFRWRELGRTEVISNNSNPSFSRVWYIIVLFSQVITLF